MALFALLVQGAFGSVAPFAVLCVHHGSCGHSRVVEEVATGCGVHGCCGSHPQDQQEERADTRPTIAIAPPCDDGCLSCVDVPLPDLDLALTDRVEIHSKDLGAYSPSAVMMGVHIERIVTGSLPPTTGPPEHLACLHAPVIRSTRLLI